MNGSMTDEVLFVGPIGEQGGPAIKNRIMTEYLRDKATLRIYNTYERSLKIRMGSIWAIMSAKQGYTIIAVSRKGRNLLYPFLLLKQKVSGMHYCCVVIGGNVISSFKTKIPILAMQRADLTAMETKGMQAEIQEAFHLSNTYWLPNYKQMERDEIHAMTSAWFQKEPMRFLFLSSMRNAKGVGTLLHAFQQVLKEGFVAELDFYGPIREDLDRELVEEIQQTEHVRYCGSVDNRKVLETMRLYHVFVFPTEYTGEGFPAVLVDAMAAGLPVIVSDMNDNSEIIKDGKNGWVFAHGDEKQLADRIRTCIQNREVLSLISRQNALDALQYEAGHVLNRFFLELHKKGWPV